MPRNRRVHDAQLRSAQTALREERLALAAITKVMLLEVPDPSRVLARLDAMARAAEANPRTTVSTKRMLLDATRFVRTAIQRELGKPQELFDPHVGHVDADKVDELVEPVNGNQQLGLAGQGSFLGDVEEAHAERVTTITRVQSAIVDLYRGEGVLTDRALHANYLLAGARSPLPMQSYAALVERRKELAAAGRVVSAGNGAWGLVEQV